MTDFQAALRAGKTHYKNNFVPTVPFTNAEIAESDTAILAGIAAVVATIAPVGAAGFATEATAVDDAAIDLGLRQDAVVDAGGVESLVPTYLYNLQATKDAEVATAVATLAAAQAALKAAVALNTAALSNDALVAALAEVANH